jgi:DNA primase
MNLLIGLVRSHGIRLKKASTTGGGEYHGACPGCGGEDRFHVWPEQNNGEGSYWCRQCGKGGDAIQFLRDFENLTFKEACLKLNKEARDLQFQKPDQRGVNTWEPKEYPTPENLWKERALKFSFWAYDKIYEEEPILKWLSQRGIPEDRLHLYGLGWNPGENGKDLYRARESWGLSRIPKPNGRDRPLWLPKGLVIPYSRDREILRLRIRRLQPEEAGPRYYVVPGSSMATMIMGENRKVFVVVESELDAIMIDSVAGDLVGAIALGSSSAKPDKAATRFLKKSLRVLVSLDFDEAGSKARLWWEKEFPNSKRWPPPHKDPGESYTQGVNIRAWITAGLPPALTI